MTAQNPIALIGSLPDRDKEPTNARVLDSWIAAAHDKIELDSGRLGWLIASTVVVAALQRAGVPDVKFTVYPDAEHDAWTAAYADPELYPWLLRHPQ